MRFILHSVDPENLPLMARAAKLALNKNLPEGEFGLVEYETTPPTLVSYIRRKTCITIYEHEKVK